VAAGGATDDPPRAPTIAPTSNAHAERDPEEHGHDLADLEERESLVNSGVKMLAANAARLPVRTSHRLLLRLPRAVGAAVGGKKRWAWSRPRERRQRPRQRR